MPTKWRQVGVTMTTMRVQNWGKWQSYRKDRGAPPWIKVHRNLMSNPQWAVLSDAEKGQLVSIWMIAADKSGIIPSCPKILRKICLLDDNPDIDRFIELGFLSQSEPHEEKSEPYETLGCQLDATLTTKCQPNDAPETETETEKTIKTLMSYSPNTDDIKNHKPQNDPVEKKPPKQKKYPQLSKLKSQGNKTLYPDEFESFWQAWSVRRPTDSKGKAYTAWRSCANRGVDLAILNQRASEFTVAVNPDYVPLAASWLNARGFEEPPPDSSFRSPKTIKGGVEDDKYAHLYGE